MKSGAPLKAFFFFFFFYIKRELHFPVKASIENTICDEKKNNIKLSFECIWEQRKGLKVARGMAECDWKNFLYWL